MLSRCFGAAGGRCGYTLGSRSCTTIVRRSLLWRPVARDKEVDTGSEQRIRAHWHPRTDSHSEARVLPHDPPPPRHLPGASVPRTLSLESSPPPRSPPPPSTLHLASSVAPSQPSPKVWADCKSCASVIVCQTGPFSGEKVEGREADPGPGLH